VADSIGAGAAGDATAIIQRLRDVQERLPGDALTTIVDEAAAREAAGYRPGQPVSVVVGGTMDTRLNPPIRLDGVLRTTFHGDFRVSGPSYTNLVMRMGLTSVVEVGQLKVVITSKRTWTHSPDFYQAVGLDPRRAKVVVTKSNTTFKASYQPFAHRILLVNATGASNPDLVSMPYQKRPHPLHPFEDPIWSPQPQLI
jgi:microcystin degradation protein MlrC